MPQTKSNLSKQRFRMPKLERSRDTVTLIDENFETGMPAGWTVIDGNNDGHTWTTGTTFDLLYVQPPNYVTAYAYYSDDDAGSGAQAGTEFLISPAVSCAGASAMTISYSWGHNQMSLYCYGAAQLRSYDGISWDSWNTFATYPYTANGVNTFDLTSHLPAESVQIQFAYEDPLGEWSMAFGIDNVLLEADRPTFYVWDFETSWQGWTHTSIYPFPAGWGVTPANYLGPTWQIPDSGDSAMWIDSDAAGGGWSSDSAISPAVMPPWNLHWLIYGYCNNGGSGYFINDLYAGIKYLSGSTWNVAELAHYPAGSVSGPGVDTIDAMTYAASDSIQTYFYFTDHNTWGWWAAFDNVGFYSADTGYHDVGVTRILSPPEGGIPPGVYDFAARIQNLGDYTESFDVQAAIYDTVGMNIIWSNTYMVSNFPSGADSAFHFVSGIFTIPTETYVGEVVLGITDDNPSNDTAYTNCFVPESLGQHIYWIDAQTATGSIALHGVEFDGTYFYLTGITATNETKVFALDTLGDLVWSIDQPAHCTGLGWRDMAFDRTYVGPDRIDTLYASCNVNVDRFGINKSTGTIDYYGPLPGPTDPNSPLAYMAESLYFFTADVNYLYKFIKNGSFVYQVTTPWLMSGATYDCDSLGGGMIWWSTADSAAQFKQFNPNTMSFTSRSFSCNYASTGLGFAQDFRDMDVLFSIVNTPQADYIHGFFLRWSDSTGVTEEPLSSEQISFGFARNMPNPLRKRAHITYCLPYRSSVKLSVYDITGRSITTLIDATQGAGAHTIPWGGKDGLDRNLASGIYFLKLVAGEKTDIQKVVFVE